MGRLFMTTAAIALGFAASAQAQSFADRLEMSFANDGYTEIEVEPGTTQTTVEAVKDGMKVEFVYDNATETVISQEVEAVDEDDDDDEDDADEGADEDADEGSEDEGSDEDEEDDDDEDDDEDEDDDDDEEDEDDDDDEDDEDDD